MLATLRGRLRLVNGAIAAMEALVRIERRPEVPEDRMCPDCGHTAHTPGLCNCPCHPPESIPGQFKRSHNGMTPEEFLRTAEFRRG